MSGAPLDRLLGNEAWKSIFQKNLEEGTLAHAYLLEGGKGSGRHTLALALLETLAGDNPHAFKIPLGISPDVTLIGIPENKKTIGVDQIRVMKSEAYLRPNDLDFRAFVIEDAGAMTVQAQNAALKLFEEPPAGVCFFLLCENAGQLLPTVRSRMQCIRMERLDDETLKKVIRKSGSFPEERIAEAVRTANGCLGQALEVLGKSDDGADGRERQVRELLDALAAKDYPLLLALWFTLPGFSPRAKDRGKMDAFLADTQTAIRDILLARRGETASAEYLFFKSAASARACARLLPDRSLLLIGDRLTLARADLAGYANFAMQKNILPSDLLIAAAGKPPARRGGRG